MTSALEGIAIVGMAGRFPGAATIEQFWQNLRVGVESIGPFTDAEVRDSGIDPALLANPHYVKAGGVLDDIAGFDAAFFGFNPREATLMDPQQRLFLESAWEALERAGYAPSRCPGRVGVYAGVSSSDYWQQLQANPDLIADVGGYQTLLGNDKDFLSTRISYKLNLTGPSLTVQTACSTSLVATVLACQSLLTYQCDLALAGGASIHTPQKAGYLYQPGGILSPDGHCRAFDAAAQGTVGGNGVGIVVLKRLEEAIAEGDTIYAVIRGAAINNDGAAKVGYTAPSVEGQATAIAEALGLAEVDPDTITYIEAHGTGTALGDPIEIAALTQVFRARTQRRQFCAIGSVKTNIGHLDAAAGIAGLIKTVLALQHRQIPPSLHFQQPNPQIDFAQSPFYVNTKLEDWSGSQGLQRAGVSSLGIGGTNAHVILEAAPDPRQGSRSRPWQLLLLSAKTPTALETATQNLAGHLQQHPELDLADVAYTLQVGREGFGQRRILVCQSREEALTLLEQESYATGFPLEPAPPVIFLLPGQGAQYPQMGRDLYEVEPLFRQQVDDAAEKLRPILGLDLCTLLYPEPEQVEAAQQQLQQTWLAQPALFVVEYALAQLWMAWGIKPQALLGHSLGEYVAACLAGVFSLEDALSLVAARGRLMQQMLPGKMLAVFLSEEALQHYLGDSLWLAAHNGPELSVVSGTSVAISNLQAQLQAQGIAYRPLHTSHAFHSPMMAPALEPLLAQVQQMALNPPQIPLISNVTGTWITAAAATDPNYWTRHLCQPVRFSEGVQKVTAQGHTLLLEVGPGRTLTTLARQHSLGEATLLTSLRHPQEEISDQAFLLNTLGNLWFAGLEIDWSAFYVQERRQRVLLPPYPFEHQHYWIDAPAAAPRSLEKQDRIEDWFYLPSWKRAAPLQSSQPEVQASCWLFFVDAWGLGAELAEQLRAAGKTVTTVAIGSEFEQAGTVYRLNPQQPDAYERLVQELERSGQLPEAIVHGWSLTPALEIGLDAFDAAQEVGFYSLLHLAQALGGLRGSQPLSIWILSNQVHAITGEETLRPEQATLLGWAQVIPQEFPQWRCHNLDLALPAPPTAAEIEQWAARLLVDLSAPTSERIIAYRGQHCWLPTFESVALPAPAGVPNRLRPAGVYLITGGLAGLGTPLAEYLAQSVQARLALIEPEDFPQRQDWGQWLVSQSEADPTCRKIRTIRALEATGAQVLVCRAAISDREQMQRAIATIQTHFGQFHGIIHTAETTAEEVFRPILQTGRAECQWQFAPKVQGLRVLAQILAGQELDFCLVQSSISSYLGGFVSHAAANWFMDTFVQAQHQTEGLPWISVNWEGWQFWSERVDADTALTITPAEGVETFRRILGLHNTAQVVVSTTDLRGRIERQFQPVPSSPVAQAQSCDLHGRPSLKTDYVAPGNAKEATIAAIWQELLGIGPIGIHDNFFDLGGHSLLAVQVISRLREAFHVELPLRILLVEQPTVAGLAQTIGDCTSATVDQEAVDQILQDLSGLSPDEIEQLLATQQ